MTERPATSSPAPAPWAVTAERATPAAGPAEAAPGPGGPPGPRRGRGVVALGALAVVLVAGGITAGVVLGTQDDVPPAAGSDESSSDADGGSAPFGAAVPPPLQDGTDDDPAAGSTATASPTTASAPTSAPVTGALDVGVPMSTPACDGSWMVFLGAATEPATYAADVQALLGSHAGARYTLTRGGCSSMRQQLDDGSLIYAVFVGPYADQATACSARAAIGGEAYVKRLYDVTPPTQLWQC